MTNHGAAPAWALNGKVKSYNTLHRETIRLPKKFNLHRLHSICAPGAREMRWTYPWMTPGLVRYISNPPYANDDKST
jgi:hypothetical protein